MTDLAHAAINPAAVILDPTLRVYRRRYFVHQDNANSRRAFTATGARRIASRTPYASRRATIKFRWDRAVEREQAHRRAVGWP